MAEDEQNAARVDSLRPGERGGGTAAIQYAECFLSHFIEGEGMLYQLSHHGICASSGSACTSGSLEPSDVLRAMGVPFTAAHGSIRFSLSVYNTKKEMDYIIEHLPVIIARLRDISPFWKDYLKSQKRV